MPLKWAAGAVCTVESGIQELKSQSVAAGSMIILHGAHPYVQTTMQVKAGKSTAACLPQPVSFNLHSAPGWSEEHSAFTNGETEARRGAGLHQGHTACKQ